MAQRRTGESGGSRIPLGAGSQTLKGAILVGAAVLLGIVLLNVVDDGNSGPVASKATTSTTSATTTTTVKKTTSTTAKSTAAKKPAQVHLLVLNAGAPNGSAGTVSTTLKGKGYTNQGKPATDPNHRSGNQVLCRAGLTREAAALKTLMGTGTTTAVLTNASTAPPGSAGYDCVVLVGA